MLLRIYSDIHQEAKKYFNIDDFKIEKLGNEKEQILILAGDYLNIRDLKHKKYVDDLKYLSERFKKVLYIFGNHEYYHSKIGGLYDLKNIKSIQDIANNIFVLSRHTPSINIDGIKFVGATLWTDLSSNNNINEDIQNVNDFKYIKSAHKGFTKFKPKYWIHEHIHDLRWIKDEVQKDNNPVIVITHHSPSSLFNDPIDDPCGKYGKYYKSNQDQFIIDNPNIKMWIHGHIHHPFDYHIGETRIFSNPQDYGLYKDDFPQRSLIEI